MKILLTGANGLLGQKIISIHHKFGTDLIATAKGPYRGTIPTSYRELDITSEEEISRILDDEKPDTVIHAAAMTNVDACETEKDLAWKTNAGATRFIARHCGERNIHLVHISTDFIFDGLEGPYKEDARPAPVSFYGETKLEAEKAVMESAGTWAILRTVLVYGVTPGMSRSNIVLWARQSLIEGKQINVVNDQVRSPTLAEDLAEAALTAATKKKEGIYHVSGPEVMSIFEMVEAIADFFGLEKALINPVNSDTLNQPAKRPPVTGFIIEKAEKELGFKPHNLREGLKLVSEQLGKLG